MRSLEVLLLFCIVLGLFVSGTGRVKAAKNDHNLIYERMLKEYHMMLSQVQPSISKTSCQNSCHQDMAKRWVDDCHCDEHCVEFRDCCLDYWKSCNASFLDTFNHTRRFECVEPTLKLSNHTKLDHLWKLGYQVVTKCPETFRDPELQRKCENPDPVESSPFVEGEDGRTYRNVDCALCNGIKTWNNWNTSLTCTNRSTLELLQARLEDKNYSFSPKEREMIRSSCTVKMSPRSDGKHFHCRIVTECQDRKSPDFLKCLSYKQQLYSIVEPTFRNPHCVQCSKIPLVVFSLTNFFSGGEGDKSLAILFDFSKASQIYGSGKVEHIQRCKDGEVYDFEQKSCRKQKFSISNNVAKTNWSCEFLNETFPNSSVVVFDNGSIFVPAHRKIYDTMDYFSHNGNITVCGNLTKNFSKFYKRNSRTRLYSKAEFHLTVIGYTLSIFALLVVLVTYSLFSELRTLPGKIVMNLAVALLLSQVVFLLDMSEDVSGSSCKGIAIILHFLYVASFSWMTVIAFDVAKTFAKQGRRSQTDTHKRALGFCVLYAWGFPFLLVSITFGVDSSGAMDVGYGNTHYCWITNPIALAIFFVGPVVIMMVFNIVALVLVLVSIRRERKITKAVLDKSTTRQDFSICCKLTAVFGLTWLLGLGAPYHIALRIAFILCNSLQGFFLMVGFVLTRRTFNLYLRVIGMRPLISRTAPTRSTASSSRGMSKLRRSSSSVAKAKPLTKQPEVSDAFEEITAVKESLEMPRPVEVKTIETDV